MEDDCSSQTVRLEKYKQLSKMEEENNWNSFHVFEIVSIEMV